MNKEQRLLQIAERQQGYFTSRQAEGCGFFPPNFHRKVQSGKWRKEDLRGIYRLANYPSTPHPELALWTLWSADKQGNPQGIWSHETALDIHGLSDVSPAKLHMSVPRNFRKSTEIPNNLCLHFANQIPQSDVEIRQGYRVTTPLRTLADVIREGTTQPEQIELAILDLAIQKSLIKGLATIQEMEQLQKFTDSQEMREIIAKAIDDVWTRANTQLAEFGRMAEPYTIGLSLEDQGLGTAVLCQYKSQYFFLTAGHIGRALRKAKSVKILLRFDNFRREYPAQSTKKFTVIEWDPALDEKDLDDVLAHQPKDLSLVIPTGEIIDMLKNYKDFYKIPEEAQGFLLRDAFISLGGIEPIYSDDGKTCQLRVGPFGFVASNYRQLPDSDYLVCPVSNHTYEMRNLRRKTISSFQGLSGSGLWKFINNTPLLIGIAIAQDPIGYDPSSGLRNVYFHGPHSILSALSTLGQTHEPNL
ncbi:MAG: type IV toxin-antitoxin system AbiEi family antitoxin domain-containing protein [Chlamydiota bacterium]